VKDLLMRLSSFGKDVERGLPDAQRLLDDYTEEQKRRVEHIKEVCYLLSRKSSLLVL
jgi:hypothetical protein